MMTTYTIRELADEFDITTRTLRFYEEKGLLKPSRNNTTRAYSSSDRTRLRLILRGKRLGLTLEESSFNVRAKFSKHWAATNTDR
jgi:DNA-binding transcriptional MerR regulator